jgi:hypothetical protein
MTTRSEEDEIAHAEQATDRARIDAQILICLGGRCATRRARRPDREGWVRTWSDFELLCMHEAGHVVAAAAVGFSPKWVIVGKPERVPGGTLFRGRASASDSDNPDSEQPSLADVPGETDFQRVTALCKVMCPGGGWLGYARGLWKACDTLLGDRWRAVRILAIELGDKGVVRRADIEDVLQRF